MATTSIVTAAVSSDIAFVFTDTAGGSSITETASLAYSLTLGTGIGTGQINAAVKYTGYLPSGGYTSLDFTAFPKPLLGGEYDVNFTSVKGVVIENQWNGSGAIGAAYSIESPAHVANLSISADISNGFTGLFNESTDHVRIGPQSTWMFNDRIGISPHSSNKILKLADMNGSGIPVALVVVGVTG